MYVKLLVLGRHLDLVLPSPLPVSVTKAESEPNKICVPKTHRQLLLARLNLKKQGRRERFASWAVNVEEIGMAHNTQTGFKHLRVS